MKIKSLFSTSLMVAGILLSGLLFGQTNDSQLSIERIYSDKAFTPERFGPARWIENGAAYTTLEPSSNYPGAKDIIKYVTTSGHRSVLISANDLIPEGEKSALNIANYSWSHDKNSLLIFTNTKKVWRQNSRGDYWVYNIKDKTLKQVGKDKPESSLMFAKFSPDDSKIGYVSHHNIYVEELSTGATTTLTSDGTDKIINGTFDWAYEEEFGIRDGFRWSPDGKNIAYWQLDASDIKVFDMINNTDSVYSFIVPVQYPKVGQDPSSCKIGYVSVTGGSTTWLNIPGDAKQNYLPRMMWSPDSKNIFAQQLNRKQNTNRVWSYDLAASTAKNVFTDEDAAWVDVVNDWIWLKKGKEFTWLSEKDGWRHFYRIAADGSSQKLVTVGDYDVINILQIDDDNGFVYFIASPDNPTQRYLYRVPLRGSDKPERISPKNQEGSHSYQIAEGSRYAFHTFSNANTPPSIDLVTLPENGFIRTLVDNKVLKEAFDKIDKKPIEFFTITTVDSVEMEGFILTPPDFDENKKYPVLFYVYGEPAGQTARDGFSSNMWNHMLAQQGYIIITVDNRGTPSPKGRDWRKSIYRKIGVINSRDQAMAAKEIMKWDFVDSERIGVWGWSGGGSMTLNLLFRYPEIYKTGMSVAPVGNQLLYDNIYQERYMGLKSENEADFIEGSPVTYAKNLAGNLLIVHGTGDDNVHYQNTEIVINELIRNNIQFDMMSYPNRSHSIREGTNTRKHLYTLLTRYLNEHLEPGGIESKLDTK